MNRRICGNRLRQRLTVAKIDLIEHKHGRKRIFLYLIYNRKLDISGRTSRLRYKHNRIGRRHRLTCGFVHVSAESCACLMHSGSIEKDKLFFPFRKYSGYSVSCSLRLRRNNCDLLAENRIHKSGFTHIRSAAYCDKCCLSHMLKPFLLPGFSAVSRACPLSYLEVRTFPFPLHRILHDRTRVNEERSEP